MATRASVVVSTPNRSGRVTASGFLIGVFFAMVLVVSGCAPSLSPLYRDYAVEPDSSSLDDRIVAALQEAGWDTVDTRIPNAIATEERVLSQWGIYRVTANLEITPLGSNHVRVFIHPYRRYIFGGKGKIPFLTRALRSRLLPDLRDAFERQGFIVAGTVFDRDEGRLR